MKVKARVRRVAKAFLVDAHRLHRAPRAATRVFVTMGRHRLRRSQSMPRPLPPLPVDPQKLYEVPCKGSNTSYRYPFLVWLLPCTMLELILPLQGLRWLLLLLLLLHRA